MGGAAPIIGGALSLGGALLGNKSSSKAAKAQTNAAKSEIALQKEMYEQARADLAPWRESGNLANTELSRLLGLSGSSTSPGYGSLTKPFSLTDYLADPGYQFRLDQGNEALAKKQSASGNFYSGKALLDAADYNSNMAAQEYGAAYGRYNTDNNNLYSRLGGMSNSGSAAVNTGVGAGQNYANNAGQAYANIGSAQANAAINSGNNWAQGLAGLMGSQYGNSAQTQPFYASGGTGQNGFWLGNTYYG